MYYYVMLAFGNGLLIAQARVLNARLSESKGPLQASLWNHLVGFLLLIILVTAMSGFTFLYTMREVPTPAYLGGFIGACFVALNSFVMPKIGALRTILLVISGQMITASFLDLVTDKISSVPTQILGISLILIGTTVARRANLAAKAPTDK